MARSMPNLGSTIKLGDFVKSFYVGSKQNDIDFAATAEKELGFSVTRNNIAGMRKALGIEANTRTIAKEKARTVLERLANLEEQVGKLLELLDGMTAPGKGK